MSVHISFDEIDISGASELTHESTSWEVSKNPDFSVVSDHILTVANDTTDLYSKTVDYDLSDSEIIYARVKVHFAGNENSEWSETIEISETSIGFTFNSVIIGTPVITTSAGDAKLPTGEFTMMTTPFNLYTGVESHMSTTWRIEDTNGNIVYERLEDTENLLSISVPAAILRERTAYFLKAQHITENNVKSNFGKLTVVTENELLNQYLGLEADVNTIKTTYAIGTVTDFESRLKSFSRINTRSL